MLQSEDFENAVSYLTKAALYKTDSEDVVYNLGFALYKLGRLQEAVPHFEKALELSPEMVSAQKALEQIQKALEKKEKLGAMMVQAQSQVAQEKARQLRDTSTTPQSASPPNELAQPVSKPAASVAAPKSAAPVVAAKDPKIASMASVPVAINDDVIKSMTPEQLNKARSASPTPYFLARNGATSDGYWGLQYSADALRAPGPYPADVTTTIREAYLSVQEFKAIFGLSKQEFYNMPKWKRNNIKKEKGLF